MLKRIGILTSVFWLFCAIPTMAADPDTLLYKNVLKVNITAPVLWGSGNYILEYERLLTPKVSARVGLGYRSFPKFLDREKGDSAFIIRDHINHGGLGASVDMKYYLLKENKYPAPRGIYIGPFVSYFSTHFENSFHIQHIDPASFTVDTRFKVLGVGFQLGYQFLFWDRVALDLCLVGPSASWYYASLNADASLDLAEHEFYEEFQKRFGEQYPIINLLAEDLSIDRKGRLSKITYGYRYYISIGIAF